jgi:NADH dehydrogenase FAD-containing subunit
MLRGSGYRNGGRVSLVTGGPPPAQSYPPGVQRRIIHALRRMKITVLPDACVGVKAGEILLAGGASLVCDAPVLAVGADAPRWLVASGLMLDEAGFVGVNRFQQSASHPNVFAAGDVATRLDTPHARSGVYAVGAGRPLLANLQAALRGKPLQPYSPAARTLNLISCGERYAIAAWGRLHLEGRWVWHLKDRIDRGFVARYAKS